MNLESRPLGLSLVDFFGALLPGMVWALLAVALGSSILKPGADGFPVGAAIALIKDAGPRNIIAFLIGSVLAGYAIKPLAMRGSDMLLLSIQYLPARVFQSTKSPLRVRGFRD